MMTSLMMSFSLFTNVLLQTIGTLGSFILMMTKNCKLVQKKSKNAAIDYIVMTSSATNTVKR